MDKSQPIAADDAIHLRAERDAALLAARTAIRDTTRLTRLFAILSDPTPLELLLDRVLSTISELFSADIVILLDPAGKGTFSPLAAIGLPEDIINEPFSNVEGSYTAAAMKSQAPILLEDMDKDPNMDFQLRDLGAKTSVWLPVIGNFIGRGVLILARCKPVPFLHADVGLLSAMTYRIGLSLEQAQRSSQLREVVNVGKGIAHNLDEKAVCSEAVSKFPSIIGADSAALLLKDAFGKFNLIAENRLDLGYPYIWEYLTEYLISNTKLNNTRLYTTSNLQKDFEDLHLKFSQRCPNCALLAIPILIKEQIHGVLVGMRFSVTTFNPDTQHVAMLFTGQVSSAIENARLYQSVRDELIEREKVERALRASDDRFRALIRSVSDVISILTANGQISYVSPAAEIAWGCQAKTLLNQNLFDRIHPNDIEAMRTLLSSILEQPDATLTQTVRLRQGFNNWRDFEVILTNLVDDPAVAGIVVTCHDITERKTYEQKLRKLAFRDPLTGLPNRAHFTDTLNHALLRANFNNQSVGVIFFDVDNFKMVNDSLGHAWGDQVLCVIADRLRACMRKNDTAARLGGDEFTILIEGVTDSNQVTLITNRLIDAMKEPIRYNDRDLFVSGSLGVAISIPNQDTVDDLLRKADLAMYEAKRKGKGSYAFFDPKLNSADTKRNVLKTELFRAFEQKEFRVYYQPVFSLNDRHICEVEAFVRWQHPQQGLMLPSEYIPLAEEAGLIIELGKWVLQESFSQFRKWQLKYQGLSLLLSVNPTAQQLRLSSFLNDVNTALHENALNPSSLMLEITESDLVSQPETITTYLKILKSIGVQIALGDFGNGNSNMNHLKQLPVDTLKINLSFFEGIDQEPRSMAICKGVVSTALSFGMTVIGTGIETDEQIALLRSLGCLCGQGPLLSHALPADEFEGLLEREQLSFGLANL